MSPPPSPYWSKHRHADRAPFLRARTAILRAVRGWFEAQGFVEVEPAALTVSPGAEVHVDAFEAGDVQGPGPYLHTSPEFAMKKLLAAGEEKIFYLAKVWRRGETGPLHAPEFTMLEWYRAGEPYERVQQDCLEIARAASTAIGVKTWERDGCTLNPFADANKWAVDDAMGDCAGLDLLATILEDGCGDRDALARQLADRFSDRVDFEAVWASPGDTWSDIFSKLMTSEIEPNLFAGALMILDQYPAPEAALARRCAHDPRVAERFELYACGVELANGFGELTDPVEQRARLEAAMAEKEKRYGKRWPIDEDFLAALAHVPPASGCALGFDRLVMLASGARHINDVMWTPQG